MLGRTCTPFESADASRRAVQRCAFRAPKTLDTGIDQKDEAGSNQKSQPYNNTVIVNSSFAPAADESRAAALLFPAFKYVPDIQLNDDSLARFVRAFLLPKTLHASYDRLPESTKRAMTRVPQLANSFPSAITVQHSPTILICSHGGRDQRCGIMGPLLQAEFKRVMRNRGYDAGDDNGTDPVVDRPGHCNIGVISHIGGHKYAGNVIVYIPPTAVHSLAGAGIWYGRVEPKHVDGIVEETIVKGRVIKDHFRGGISKDGTILSLH